jgi:uncharacterized protein YndB with AHSA1/START domain
VIGRRIFELVHPEDRAATMQQAGLVMEGMPQRHFRNRYIHKDGANEWGFHGVFHGDLTPGGMTQTFEFEGAPGHVSLDKLTLEERDGRTIARTHSVYQSVEDRNAMVESGMEEGMNDGFDRLDDLLAKLATPV